MDKRKIAGLIAAGALLISAAACHRAPDITKYRSEYSHKYAYSHLSPAMQKQYDAVYTALTDRFSEETAVSVNEDDGVVIQPGLTVSLPTPLASKAEAQALYDAVTMDNPRLFYIANTYSLSGNLSGGNTVYNDLVLFFEMGVKDRESTRNELDAVLQTWIEEMPTGLDDYGKELYFHDRLIDHCKYDSAAADAGSGEYPMAYTAYGALVEHSAVCEGYSKAMQILCDAVDIPCRLTIGHSLKSGEAHMWNAVTVDGNDYHLDATWDDASEELLHTFFNVTDEELAFTHEWENENGTVCTATEANFYHRNGTYCDTYHRQDIAEAIAKEIRQGKDKAELRFSPETYDSALLFLKSTDTTRTLVNNALGGSGKQFWAPYSVYYNDITHTVEVTEKK